MKKSFLLSLAFVLAMVMGTFTMNAQSTVKWTSSVKMTSKNEGVITLVANIENGWHLYGFNQNPDGPVSTTVTISAPKGVKFTDKLSYSPAPISMQDDMFGCDVTYWENKVTFTRHFKLSKVKEPKVTFSINYMTCNDSNCQPPKTDEIQVVLK